MCRGLRKVCFNPHNYYSRAMVIYDRGTLSQVQAYTHEKLCTLFFFAPAARKLGLCVYFWCFVRGRYVFIYIDK